jgi:hypothetical protein
MWLFFTLPVIAIVIASLAHAFGALEKVRMNWNEYRCNPAYMPFASLVREDTTVSDNFYSCMNVLGNEVMKGPLDAVSSSFGLVNLSLKEVIAPLPLFRNMFGRMRKFVISFAIATFSKIASSTSVFVHYLTKIKDILKRFVGQGYIASYLTYILISFIESFVSLFISILKSFVIVMLAISFVLALFQPGLLVVVLILASMLAASGA